MYYKCHKVNFKRGGSYTYSPDWIKKKIATINPKNTDNKCFQYAGTVALNYEEIESYPETVSNIKPSMNKYNWEGINNPSKRDDWKTFEKNNLTIALNILYIKEKEICPAYISKINSNCEKQIILSMILNEDKEGWHYLAVKNLSTLLRGVTSKHHGNFYCLNCLHSFRTENKLKSHEKICKNKYFCGIVMPSKKNNILEFNQYMKSDKMPYIIYADIESLIRKIDGCVNNPEKSSTPKIGEHIPCRYSMSTIWRFDHVEDKHTLHQEKDCMKKILPLTKEELKSHEDAKLCYICGKKILKKFVKDKNYQKVRDQCHYTGKDRGAAHSICNLNFKMPNEIPIVFHNGSNNDYHFIIKELANEFEGQFECLGKISKSTKLFPLQ